MRTSRSALAVGAHLALTSWQARARRALAGMTLALGLLVLICAGAREASTAARPSSPAPSAVNTPNPQPAAAAAELLRRLESAGLGHRSLAEAHRELREALERQRRGEGFQIIERGTGRSLQPFFELHPIEPAGSAGERRFQAAAPQPALRRGRSLVALEVKAGRRFSDSGLRGLRAIAALPGVRRRIVIYPGERRMRTADGIDILPLADFLQQVEDGSIL